jgi:predicted dinucleotide-binding enzyme
MTIAIIGGTGPQGKGLALRFARAGIPVALGSRDRDRAAEVAADLAVKLGGGAAPIQGHDNEGRGRRRPVRHSFGALQRP